MAPKNIVLCSDGTGNTSTKGRGTNVFKIYEAVDIHGYMSIPDCPRQVAYYCDGVGTDNFAVHRMIGAAFGYGFAASIRKLYTALVHVYTPGDKLFLFGFSRGAYTIRALAGMIQHCGILQREIFPAEADLEARVHVCWKQFEKVAFPRFISDAARRAAPASKDTGADERRTQLGSYPDEPEIEFIGVWDTVGAVGMPVDELKPLINWICPRKFDELNVGQSVKRACHALSIDDERRTFHPELWNEEGARAGQVDQVWFAGVHSNVGGGYPKHGMSLVSLDWMMDEASLHGLRFIPAAREYVRKQQNVHDKHYDSRAGYGVYYRWEPRDILKICEEYKAAKPKIHVSVFERIANTTDGYAPGNIPATLEIVQTRGMPQPQSGRRELLQSVIQNELGTLDARSLLNLPAMRFWRGVGYLSYYGFLVLTLAALYHAVPAAQGGSVLDYASAIVKHLWNLFTSTAAIWDLLKKLAGTWWFLPGLLACYVLALLVDRQLERRFSSFWHKIRVRLDLWGSGS